MTAWNVPDESFCAHQVMVAAPALLSESGPSASVPPVDDVLAGCAVPEQPASASAAMTAATPTVVTFLVMAVSFEASMLELSVTDRSTQTLEYQHCTECDDVIAGRR
ncbi:MAG: hypothetical protein J0I40_02970 [Cellulomonas sp.]|nr:hypothetical protein [Cellulomonas sp.]